MRIVAVTGMPGAGKSTATKSLVAQGWERVVMGDVVREETRRRGMVADSKSTGEVMKDLRRKHGDSAIAELCLQEIRRKGADRVVVDGIRSTAEVDAFRKEATVILVAIHASPERRFQLLRERGRSDDPLTRGMFLERDARELGVGIGNAIAFADEVISNEHSTPEQLAATMAKLVDDWVKRTAA